jgi:site-specific recombinase XerD
MIRGFLNAQISFLEVLNMEKVPVPQLITLLEQELVRQGYKDATLKYYRGIWKRIAAYFESCNEVYFSESVAMEYVDGKCDFFKKEKAGQLTQSNVWLFRVVRMMGDFQQHGAVLRRYSRSLSRVNEPLNQQYLEKFAAYCKSNEYAISTQKSYRHTAENFLCFLEARQISPDVINAGCLNDFVKTLMGYSYKMVEFVLCGTRAFLHFLYSEALVSVDWSGALPCMQARRQTRIPSVWSQDDLTKLLAAIDRGNSSGKRDYAIILLVARLGLRSIDVKRLTFKNFNWNENYLEFSQSKTQKLVRLPLLKDVGWGVIDYLQNGRPVSDSPYIFLRHLAPIGPFSDEDHLSQIIVKYMRLAKIPVAPQKKVGMHSLRHTLATTLMEQHTPIERIADILGHQSTDSTPTYLKSSLNLLRECALDPEVSL